MSKFLIHTEILKNVPFQIPASIPDDWPNLILLNVEVLEFHHLKRT